MGVIRGRIYLTRNWSARSAVNGFLVNSKKFKISRFLKGFAHAPGFSERRPVFGNASLVRNDRTNFENSVL